MAYDLSQDTRERILQRLLAILAPAATGAATVVRNRGLLSADARPAIALLDGDESARLTGDRRGRVEMGPQIMELRPQIFYLPKPMQPANVGLGEDVSAFRLTIIQVIKDDAELKELVGPEGNIVYRGMETDLKSGGLLLGQARFDFLFVYVLDPA